MTLTTQYRDHLAAVARIEAAGRLVRQADVTRAVYGHLEASGISWRVLQSLRDRRYLTHSSRRGWLTTRKGRNALQREDAA